MSHWFVIHALAFCMICLFAVFFFSNMSMIVLSVVAFYTSHPRWKKISSLMTNKLSIHQNCNITHCSVLGSHQRALHTRLLSFPHKLHFPLLTAQTPRPLSHSPVSHYLVFFHLYLIRNIIYRPKSTETLHAYTFMLTFIPQNIHEKRKKKGFNIFTKYNKTEE